MITTKEASKILGLQIESINAYCREGRIEGAEQRFDKQIGQNRWFVPDKPVIRFLRRIVTEGGEDNILITNSECFICKVPLVEHKMCRNCYILIGTGHIEDSCSSALLHKNKGACCWCAHGEALASLEHAERIAIDTTVAF